MRRAILEIRKIVRQKRAEGVTQNELAQMIPMDSGNFSRLLRDEHDPKSRLTARITAVFGFPLEFWDEEADQSEVDALSAEGE